MALIASVGFLAAAAWAPRPAFATNGCLAPPAGSGYADSPSIVLPAGLVGGVRTDDFSTTGAVDGSTGWSAFGLNDTAPGGLGASTYDSATGAYRARVSAAAPGVVRVTGVRTTGSGGFPYSAVGAANVVRAKFHVFRGGQTDPANLNTVPALRMRVNNRFAVTTLLEIQPPSAADPGNAGIAAELMPSADAANPSVYRVDLDPIDTPALVAAAATESVGRAFETLAADPAQNGYLAMTESSIGVYAASLVPTTAAVSRAYGPGEVGVSAGALLTTRTLSAAALAGGVVADADPAVTGVPLYSENGAGATLDTTAMTSAGVGLATLEFYAGASLAARPRFEEGRLYKVRFHLTAAGVASSENAQIMLRSRGAKFSYMQRLVVGGSRGAGALNNLLAAEALPGTGCANPDQSTPGEPGGWYTLMVSSPLSADIRPAFAPGTPVAQRMPLFSALPGPGANAASGRDVKLGLDLIDTIDSGAGADAERGLVTVDRIEVRDYPQVAD